MEKIFGRPIVTQEDMKRRIEELGRQIASDYAGKDLILVGILKGAFAFHADLARAIRAPLLVDFLIVTSYGSKAKTSGKVKMVTDLTEDIKGRDVLLVEDIVDSGLTLSWLRENLESRGPASVEIFALLRKPEAAQVEIEAKYVGFEIPNAFVVGYGLDYAERYRNLRSVAVLAPHVYT